VGVKELTSDTVLQPLEKSPEIIKLRRFLFFKVAYTLRWRKIIDPPGASADRLTDLLLGGDPGAMRALVVALAPVRMDRWDKTSNDPRLAPKPEPFGQFVDNEYVQEQFGALQLPMGILSSSSLRRFDARFDLVVVFITKFDLFSYTDQIDNTHGRTMMNEVFKDHIDRIAQACTRRGLAKPVVIVGSANKAWGYTELEDILHGALKAEAKKRHGRR
jgi:hypothetical protein